MTDLVRISQLELDCIVGIRPHERIAPQRVRVDVELQLNTREAARAGRIELTADYDRVAHEISALLRFRRYRLVEMAAEEVCAMLLGTYDMLSAVRLQLEKPGALEGRARAAAIEVHRTRVEFTARESADASYPRELTRTRDARLHLHRLLPGDGVPERSPLESRVISWVVLGELSDELGNVRTCGLAETCEPTHESSFRNVGSEPVLLFRCAVTASGT